MLATHGTTAQGNGLSSAVAAKSALQNAATLLADYMIPQLKTKVLDAGRVVTVKITGVTSAAQLDYLESVIKRMAGIDSVERRNFSLASHTAMLDITTFLRIQQVARAFSVSTSPRFAVQSSTGQMMSIALIHRK